MIFFNSSWIFETVCSSPADSLKMIQTVDSTILDISDLVDSNVFTDLINTTGVVFIIMLNKLFSVGTVKQLICKN